MLPLFQVTQQIYMIDPSTAKFTRECSGDFFFNQGNKKVSSNHGRQGIMNTVVNFGCQETNQ